LNQGRLARSGKRKQEASNAATDGIFSRLGFLAQRPERVARRSRTRSAGRSYQADVYQALHEAGIEPDWIVGPSIGALAGAADNRYTREMLPALLQSWTPKLLVWGEDDEFQTVDFAERYAREIPETRLVRIKSAGHIPMENDPKAVAGALAEFFAAEARSA
jgi:pimeloyl-ACP methyl ester carboxylesterase